MQEDPQTRMPDTVSQRMNLSQRTITVDVHPIKTECDDQCPDSAKQADVEPCDGWRSENCVKQKVAQDDNEECGEAIDLMWDVHRGAELDLEQFLGQWRVAEEPDQLLNNNCNPRDGNFASEVEVSDEQGNEEEQREATEYNPEPLLTPMVIA